MKIQVISLIIIFSIVAHSPAYPKAETIKRLYRTEEYINEALLDNSMAIIPILKIIEITKNDLMWLTDEQLEEMIRWAKDSMYNRELLKSDLYTPERILETDLSTPSALKQSLICSYAERSAEITYLKILNGMPLDNPGDIIAVKLSTSTRKAIIEAYIERSPESAALVDQMKYDDLRTGLRESGINVTNLDNHILKELREVEESAKWSAVRAIAAQKPPPEMVSKEEMEKQLDDLYYRLSQEISATQ